MITAVVLTHNDATSIEKTLASIAWCDEIIVVDDVSTDKTLHIAKKFGAIIHTRALGDDFAAQRNFGLAKAKGDWVLFVDSDEVISSQLAKELQQVVSVIPASEPGSNGNKWIPGQARNDNVSGYFVKRSDFIWGRELKHGETANVRLLRLAKKDTGKWVRAVHEVWEVQAKTAELIHPLFHFPHPNVAQFMTKINAYSTLNAKVFYDEGIRTNILEIVLYPTAKFFVNYIWRRGFMDGTAGAVIAFMMSFHSFLTRGKLYLLSQKS